MRLQVYARTAEPAQLTVQSGVQVSGANKNGASGPIITVGVCAMDKKARPRLLSDQRLRGTHQL